MAQKIKLAKQADNPRAWTLTLELLHHQKQHRRCRLQEWEEMELIIGRYLSDIGGTGILERALGTQVAQEAKARKKHFGGGSLEALMKVALDGEKTLDALVEKSAATQNQNGEQILCVWRPWPNGRIHKSQAIYKEFFGSRESLCRSLTPSTTQEKRKEFDGVASTRLELPGKRRKKDHSEAGLLQSREAHTAACLDGGTWNATSSSSSGPMFEGSRVPSADERVASRGKLLREAPAKPKAGCKRAPKSLGEQMKVKTLERRALHSGSAKLAPMPASAPLVNRGGLAACKSKRKRAQGRIKVWWPDDNTLPDCEQFCSVRCVRECNVICVLSVAAALHADADSTGIVKRHVALAAVLYGKRLADRSWLTGIGEGRCLAFKAAAQDRKIAIFVSAKFAEKHVLCAAMLKTVSADSANWILIADQAEFSSRRMVWDKAHWRAQRNLKEPLCCISGKHDLHDPDPSNGWCTLEQLIQKISLTRV